MSESVQIEKDSGAAAPLVSSIEVAEAFDKYNANGVPDEAATSQEAPMVSTAGEKSYIERRLDYQADWHSKKATKSKRNFHRTELITLIAGALIPIVNVIEWSSPSWPKVLTTLLASIVMVTVGISKLYKFHETWLNYRTVAEQLEGEKELYLHRAGNYAKDETRTSDQLLAERVENILSTQTSNYISTQKQRNETAGEKK